MLCRLRGELEHCQPGRALWGTPGVCWPWQCVAHLHNQTDKPGLAGGQQQDKSEDPTYTHNMAGIHKRRPAHAHTTTHTHMHSGQVVMETTPPREPLPSHPLYVLRCPSQTGTTAVCVCVCLNYYHFLASLEEVQPRGTSKGIMYLWKDCVCVGVCVTQLLYILIPPSEESKSWFSKKCTAIESVLPKIKQTIIYSTFWTSSQSSSNLCVFVCVFVYICNSSYSVIFYWEMSAGVWGLELREEKERLAKMRTKAGLIPSSTLLVLVQFFQFCLFFNP